MNRTQAIDEMYGTFRTAWNANSPAVNGGIAPEIRYETVDDPSPPPENAPWVRLSIRHLPSEETIGKQKIYTRRGIIQCELFCPTADRGLSLCDELVIIAMNVFEGESTSGGVWFRNTVAEEVGPDKPWYKVNVVSNFEYYEVV